MHKTPLQIFSTFKQDKVKLANPIFKRTRQAAAKVKIEREKQVRNIFAFLLFRSMQIIMYIYSLDLQQNNYVYAKNIQLYIW